MLVFAVLALTSVTTTLAVPALNTRAESYCDAGGSFLNQDSFLLTAINQTVPINYTAPGDVLQAYEVTQTNGVNHGLLGYGIPGATNDQTFTLANGTLFPAIEDPTAPFGAVDEPATSGQALAFDWSAWGTGLPAAAAIYCGQASTSSGGGYEYAALLVYGDGAFSMCAVGERASVVWQASASNGGAYDFDSCYPVRLQITPA